ncbi:MAG: hypothetical protein LBT86_09895 [Deltaproteobacteria bacterium]|jgi:hypothetical protein|nr:hypothetical protein [Deltaproteobacteria bacterium]
MTHILTIAENSASRLNQVQAGFLAPQELSSNDLTVVYVIAAACLLAIIVAVAMYKFRLNKRFQRKRGWSSITNAQVIWEILTKAVARQANFAMEIYDANRAINFHGVLEKIDDDQNLVLSLSDTPSAEANFADLPGVIHINFRPAPKELLEHYQFSTKIIANQFVKRNGWREAQLLLPLPQILTSAQRRSFLRLKPADQFAFNCQLNIAPEGDIPHLEALEEIGVGEILDISIGGAQLKLPPNVTLRETQKFVGVMKLPLADLNVEINDPTLVILIQILSQEFVKESPQFGQRAHCCLRARFLGRYVFEKAQNTWIYRGLTQSTLEDLAYWMQAYQRYVIKKQSNLLPPDESRHRPPNMFPAIPPKRPKPRED